MRKTASRRCTFDVRPLRGLADCAGLRPQQLSERLLTRPTPDHPDFGGRLRKGFIIDSSISYITFLT